jgi:hypothetical protein
MMTIILFLFPRLIPSVKAGVYQYVAMRSVFAVVAFIVEMMPSEDSIDARFRNPTDFR